MFFIFPSHSHLLSLTIICLITLVKKSFSIGVSLEKGSLDLWVRFIKKVYTSHDILVNILFYK